MAKHGYTLQRYRGKLSDCEFADLDTSIANRRAKEVQILNKVLGGTNE